MRVLVADDEGKVCSALRLLLEQELGLAVVGEVSGAAELLSQVTSTGPDLLLLDWELPGLTAGDLVTLRWQHQPLQIIALSGRPEARGAALAAGADAFVSKVNPPDLLLATIQSLVICSDDRSRP
jgi:CheY-like chemotaxis protein